MKNKDELRDELNELSPFLAQQKELGEGFKVPPDYFQSLPDEVMKKVEPMTSPVEQPRQWNWSDRLVEIIQSAFRPRYALAYASVATLIVAAYYFSSGNTSEVPVVAEVKLEEISGDAIENYLTENIESVSTELLEEHFAESGSEVTPSFELDEMEDYLDDALDDLSVDDLEELL